MVWKTKEGRVCDGCDKAEVKCFWWEDLLQAKACHECSVHKKLCQENGVGQMESEAGPSKKRRVVATKGKGKEREKSEPEVGASAVAALLEEMRGVREETREVKGAITGLRDEVRALGNVGRALVKVIEAAGGDVGYIADLLFRVHGVRGETEKDEGMDVEENEEGEGAGTSGRAGESEVAMEETLH